MQLAPPTTITATPRQARFLRQRFIATQLAAGHRAWPDPRILHFHEWIARLLRHQGSPPTLTQWQEETLWEQAIASSEAAGDSLLQPAAAARAARRSWNLLHAWRLPRGTPHWDASPDTAAFSAWARNYEARLNSSPRLDAAHLTDAVHPRDLGHIRLFQLHDIDPSAALLLQRLEAAGTRFEILPQRRASSPPPAVLLPCEDTNAEIEQAAAWAFQTLKADPDSSIAVAFPDLAAVRSRAAHIFHNLFGGAVHLALAPPLADRPLVAGALAVLALAPRRMSFASWSTLLLTPWISGDSASRARLEVDMRRRRIDEWPIAAVTRIGSCPPGLRDGLNRALDLIGQWPSRQSPSQWCAAWSRLLALLGWPGPQALNSAEYQTLEAWHNALSDFAALDAVVPTLSPGTALAMLRRGLAQRRFQVEDLGQPVQLMDIEEAASLEFDHLWVAGLHAEAWPPAPSPDPFLPLALQRLHNMPGSSPQQCLLRARQLTNRLLRTAQPAERVPNPEQQLGTECSHPRSSAFIRGQNPTPSLSTPNPATSGEFPNTPQPAGPNPDPWNELADPTSPSESASLRSTPNIFFSYPKTEGERKLHPSPFLSQLPTTTLNLPLTPPSQPKTIELDDQQAPPLPLDTSLPGGARALELQARCPFQAFAEIRLGAAPLDHPELGFDARDRGTILHAALAATWQQLQNSAALLQPVSAIVAAAVDQAIASLPAYTEFQDKRLDLERRRLCRLIEAWLDVERTRPAPFTVLEPEQEKEARIGGIVLRTRIDRMDRLHDGSILLLDYKTTAPSSSAWDGDRPDSPQLPLYAVSSEHRLSGALFAQVKAADLKFSGVVAKAGVFERLRPSERNFDAMIADWRKALESLAANIRTGDATVDPKKGDETCGRCHLQMLCRIKE